MFRCLPVKLGRPFKGRFFFVVPIRSNTHGHIFDTYALDPARTGSIDFQKIKQSGKFSRLRQRSLLSGAASSLFGINDA
jgi:hypothetical protein